MLDTGALLVSAPVFYTSLVLAKKVILIRMRI